MKKTLKELAKEYNYLEENRKNIFLGIYSLVKQVFPELTRDIFKQYIDTHYTDLLNDPTIDVADDFKEWAYVNGLMDTRPSNLEEDETQMEEAPKTPPQYRGGGLKNATIEYNGQMYPELEFEADNVIDDHGNEGKDMVFVAKTSDRMPFLLFSVDVSVEASFADSGNIQDVYWDTLEVERGESETFKKTKDSMDSFFKSGKSFREGTCGYAPNGEVDKATQPSGPHLLKIRELIKKEIIRLKK